MRVERYSSGARVCLRLLGIAAALVIPLEAASDTPAATSRNTMQDTAAGLRLAETLCARCHAIAPGEIGRHPLAPTFADIANRYSVWDLQEALAEGILVGHASMPKFKLQPKDITDLLSYMDTMTKPKKPR